jgi:hypothetical protein
MIVPVTRQIAPAAAAPRAEATPALHRPLAWRRLLAPGLGFAGGLALAAAVAALGAPGRAGSLDRAAEGREAGLLARIGQLEAALERAAGEAGRAEALAARAEQAAERAESLAARAEQAEALRSPQGGRFIAAALLLQASIATPRPWLREYQAMAELAPPGALPRPLAEVLLSHAARGLPSEAELRERFVLLAPQLAARAPRQGDALDQTLSAMRGAVSGIGLVSPPAPSDQEQAIAGVGHQLRRGNLAAAVADAAALDASLQPLLAGWLAQARARLAVEQAVQETLLRALARPPSAPS